MNKLLAYVGTGEITEEDVKMLTHINIAFGNLHIDGTVSGAEHDKVKMLAQFKKWNPGIQVLLSLVPGEPDAFTVCCKNPELRQKAAESIAEFVTKYELDGIDLDWEYPCVPSNGSNVEPSDRENFTLLCKNIRSEFEKIKNKHYLLTIAAGADVYYVNCVELNKIIEYLDYICLMTYDLKCGFHALAGHHTALYSKTGDVFRNSCDQALKLFASNGVPKEKLLMGAAFYSRKWSGLKNRNNGLLEICKYGGGYGPDYDVLYKDYIDKNGYVSYWDDEACAPYLFNGDTFLSYDNERSLALKAQYVKNEGYGGIFYWEHKCDKTRTLLNTLYKEMNN